MLDPVAQSDQLLELVERRHRDLALMRDLGRQQSELIESGDLSTLLRVLGAKQRVMAELERVERMLDPFRLQTAEEREWRAPELRDRCKQMLDESTALLAEILAQEKQGEASLVRRRDAAADRLSGSHFSHQAHSAYHTLPGASVSQLDLASES